MSTYSEIAVLDVVLALIFCVFWFLDCAEEQQGELAEYCEFHCPQHRSCNYAGPCHCPVTDHMLTFLAREPRGRDTDLVG